MRLAHLAALLSFGVSARGATEGLLRGALVSNLAMFDSTASSSSPRLLTSSPSASPSFSPPTPFPTNAPSNGSCVSDDFVIGLTWGSLSFLLAGAASCAIWVGWSARRARAELKEKFKGDIDDVHFDALMAIPHDADRREVQIILDNVRSAVSAVILFAAGIVAASLTSDPRCATFIPSLGAALVVACNGFLSCLQELVRNNSRVWILDEIVKHLPPKEGEKIKKNSVGWLNDCWGASNTTELDEHDHEKARLLKEIFTQTTLITAALIGVISGSMPSATDEEKIGRTVSIAVVSLLGGTLVPAVFAGFYRKSPRSTEKLDPADQKWLNYSDIEDLLTAMLAARGASGPLPGGGTVVLGGG